jgi:Alanine dehydrogenase/PNT, N-terminal domain
MFFIEMQIYKALTIVARCLKLKTTNMISFLFFLLSLVVVTAYKLHALRAPKSRFQGSLFDTVSGQKCQWTEALPYTQLTIGVPREITQNENRVSQTPESISILLKQGFKVIVESAAGLQAQFSDSTYLSGLHIDISSSLNFQYFSSGRQSFSAGATLGSKSEVWQADIIAKIQPPTAEEAKLVGNRTLISLIYPAQNQEILKILEATKATVFALDCIPRLLSRGQTFDGNVTSTNYVILLSSFTPFYIFDFSIYTAIQ